MKEDEKYNTDIEVYNLVNDIKNIDDESCFYFRMKGNSVSIGYTGLDHTLITGFITCMEQYKELYDIINSSVLIYEEENITSDIRAN